MWRALLVPAHPHSRHAEERLADRGARPRSLTPWALGGGPNTLVGPGAGDGAVLPGVELGVRPSMEGDSAGADVLSQGTVVDGQAVAVVEVAHWSPRASTPVSARKHSALQPMVARWLAKAGPHSSGSGEPACKQF